MSRNSISIKIAGPAGFGIKTTGMIFAKLALRQGFFVFDMSEYPSLIRGGHNVFYARIDESKVLGHRDGIDFLIALNAESIRLHRDELNKNAGIIYDSETVDISKFELDKSIHKYGIKLNSIAKEIAGNDLSRNTVALGSMAYIVGFEILDLVKIIESFFGKKSDKVALDNIKCARAGYNFAKDNFRDKFEHKIHKTKSDFHKEQILISGNEAIALGAIASGCTFYAAYPMTPSSTILHTLADLSKQTGMIVRHAEDEIAVMNMCIGASYAGARAMCATSGGGFALMNEALGLAGITETPLVAVEVQRPGPATGLPTWHGQADLQFVLNSAQGEFPRVVIAPGDPEECFYLTSEAFNLADKFQTPVIVLSDKYLGESDFTVNKFDESKLTIDMGELLSQKDLINFENYKRYKITPSGVSKRSIPGMKGGRYLANSDEHDEFGYTSEESKNAIDQMEKRMRKEDAIRKNLPKPALVGSKNAEITIVSWGSTKGAIIEAIQLLSKKGIKVNFLQIKYIWPFQSSEVESILKSSKKLVLIEGNYNGQLGRLIAQETGVRIKNKILKYDGRPISADEIVQNIAD